MRKPNRAQVWSHLGRSEAERATALGAQSTRLSNSEPMVEAEVELLIGPGLSKNNPVQ